MTSAHLNANLSSLGAQAKRVFAILGTPMMLVKTLLPLALGVFALWFFLRSAYAPKGFDFSRMAIAHPGPFKGTVLVDSVFAASLVVTMVGTGLYLTDLFKFTRLLHRKPGQGFMDTAFWLTVIAILFAPLVLLYTQVMPRDEPSVIDNCRYAQVQDELLFHYFVVGSVFVLFLLIDILTVWGMQRALNATAHGTADHKEFKAIRRFAWNQIFCIDLPVLIGGGMSWLLFNTPVWVNNTILGMDQSRFALNQGWSCAQTAMSAPTFDAMIANLYLSGICAGYLAAHVLMSQLVFVCLNIMSRIEEQRAKSAAANTAAGATSPA